MYLKEYKIKLYRDSVLKLLSMNNNNELVRVTEEMLEENKRLARPLLIYDTVNVTQGNGNELILNDVVFDNLFLKRCFGNKEKVHPFLLTLGRKTDALWEMDDVLSQYVLDMLFNLTLVKAERRFRKELKLSYKYKHCSKLSPGSLDLWPIQQQIPLFELLKDGLGQIDVVLDKNCIMHPQKSLSGIAFSTNIPFSSCVFCSLENCPGREQNYQINKIDYYLSII